MDNIELLGTNDFHLFEKGIRFVRRCTALTRMLTSSIITHFLIFCTKNDEKLSATRSFFVSSQTVLECFWIPMGHTPDSYECILPFL